VTAVGNAGGTDSLTAADGVVTSLSTTITTTDESGAAGETLDGLIETDADVVAGDSGGPLIDGEGEVVGINPAASTGTVINGYAIPVDDALAVVQQIRSGNETSTVQIGASAFLGVQVTSGSSAPGALDYGYGYGYGYEGAGTSWEDQTAGALVAGLVDDSPAVAAGLEVGDTITAVDGSPVGSADDLSSVLDRHDAGDLVKLTWTDSQGGAHSESVTLAASPVA
jgi:S1-C subfamily serine protease